MSFVSLNFFLLTAISLLVYHLLPSRARWCVLLLSSLVFYAFNGPEALAIVLVTAFFSYRMAISIEKNPDSGKRKLILSVSIIILLAVLAFIKFAGRITSLTASIIVPMGISYYSLSIIGYLLDVYWKKETAEKNFLFYLTFVLYYPKIVQGPISRHRFLGPQLTEGRPLEYTQVCYGMQLMLWGYFKKLVLADRMNILVTIVYSDLENIYFSHGGLLLITMFFSAIQLYLDFSGYTDIALGVSQMFGIRLEQNFNHPFFSRSAAEFWQRWHISLSSWFKDYLFFPVSRSRLVRNASKSMGTRFGPSARKKTMIALSSAVVWLATGLWHGTGINYIVWGAYWGCIIIFSEVFDGFIQKINKAFCINTAAPTWKLFQTLRTFLIFMFGKMISAQNSLHAVKTVLFGIVHHFHFSDRWMVYELDLTRLDLDIIRLGLLLVFAVSVLQERGVRVREWIAGWNAIPRWIFYSLALSLVLLLGLYGADFDMSSFAYQFF